MFLAHSCKYWSNASGYPLHKSSHTMNTSKLAIFEHCSFMVEKTEFDGKCRLWSETFSHCFSALLEWTDLLIGNKFTFGHSILKLHFGTLPSIKVWFNLTCGSIDVL